MKDKILYLTIGLLIGIVEMQWGTVAEGDDSSPYGIILRDTGGAQGTEQILVDDNGNRWRFTYDYVTGAITCWEPAGIANLPPVDPHEVKFWQGWMVVTRDNYVWVRNDQAQTWQDCGPWPGGPVPTSPDTWGGVKGKYDGDK